MLFSYVLQNKDSFSPNFTILDIDLGDYKEINIIYHKRLPDGINDALTSVVITDKNMVKFDLTYGSGNDGGLKLKRVEHDSDDDDDGSDGDNTDTDNDSIEEYEIDDDYWLNFAEFSMPIRLNEYEFEENDGIWYCEKEFDLEKEEDKYVEKMIIEWLKND